jgi:hypothetical protein
MSAFCLGCVVHFEFLSLRVFLREPELRHATLHTQKDLVVNSRAEVAGELFWFEYAARGVTEVLRVVPLSIENHTFR